MCWRWRVISYCVLRGEKRGNGDADIRVVRIMCCCCECVVVIIIVCGGVVIGVLVIVEMIIMINNKVTQLILWF